MRWADFAEKYPPGSVHRGRDERTGRLSYRTVIDTTLGCEVLYRRGRGTSRRSWTERCSAAEWATFLDGWKGNRPASTATSQPQTTTKTIPGSSP